MIEDPEHRFPKSEGGVVTKFQYPIPDANPWIEMLNAVPSFKKQMLLRDFHISYEQYKKTPGQTN